VTLAGVVGMTRETRLKNRHKATLVAMYVAPEYGGRGLGLALLNTVVQARQSRGRGTAGADRDRRQPQAAAPL
jgi:GNAT superfamily N-acetyltransferase